VTTPVEEAQERNARLAALDREAHVWLLRPETISDADLLDHWRNLLSDEERRRLDRYRRPGDRHTFLVAHALVRLALSQYAAVSPAEWRFAVGSRGRPEIDDPVEPTLQFSLTHTPGLVACFIARDCECGVDAEAIGRRGDLPRLAQRVLSAAERGEWEALPEPERRVRFLVYWTLKEAYLKARGLGLSLPPRELSFALEDERIRLAAAPASESDRDAWQFTAARPTPTHTLATAIRRSGGPAPTVVVKEGPPRSA
jgi:4'-phosphopantetheinyl transferase